MTPRPTPNRPPAHPLHPQAEEFLEELWESDAPTLHTLSLAEACAEVDKAIGAIGAGPPVASVADIEIDVG
jgi:hypothetical protein